MDINIKFPSEEAIKEAMKHPKGWVYVIDEKYLGKEDVLPEGIVGAWKVNHEGVIEGHFIPNPNYES